MVKKIIGFSILSIALNATGLVHNIKGISIDEMEKNYKNGFVVKRADLNKFLKQQNEIKGNSYKVKSGVVVKDKIQNITINSSKQLKANATKLKKREPNKYNIYLKDRNFYSILESYVYARKNKLYVAALLKNKILNKDFDPVKIDFEFFVHDFKKNSIKTANAVLRSRK